MRPYSLRSSCSLIMNWLAATMSVMSLDRHWKIALVAYSLAIITTSRPLARVALPEDLKSQRFCAAEKAHTALIGRRSVGSLPQQLVEQLDAVARYLKCRHRTQFEEGQLVGDPVTMKKIRSSFFAPSRA